MVEGFWIVEKSVGQERVLYALLAGAGLRVGEALGLESQHISEDFRRCRQEKQQGCAGLFSELT
jgi:integrase